MVESTPRDQSIIARLRKPWLGSTPSHCSVDHFNFKGFSYLKLAKRGQGRDLRWIFPQIRTRVTGSTGPDVNHYTTLAAMKIFIAHYLGLSAIHEI